MEGQVGSGSKERKGRQEGGKRWNVSEAGNKRAGKVRGRKWSGGDKKGVKGGNGRKGEADVRKWRGREGEGRKRIYTVGYLQQFLKLHTQLPR